MLPKVECVVPTSGINHIFFSFLGARQVDRLCLFEIIQYLSVHTYIWAPSSVPLSGVDLQTSHRDGSLSWTAQLSSWPGHPFQGFPHTPRFEAYCTA